MPPNPLSFGQETTRSENLESLSPSGASSKSLQPVRNESATPSGTSPRNANQDLPNFKETEPKRVEVSIELSNRYIKLRDEIALSKREIAALRKEFAEKQEQQSTLVGECREDEVNRGRLENLIGCLSQLAAKIQDNENASLTPSQKLEVMKRALAPCLQWNLHLSALTDCLTVQQEDVIRAGRPYSGRHRSMPPSNAWIP